MPPVEALLALPGVMRQAQQSDTDSLQKAQAANLATAVTVGFAEALDAMVLARSGEGARLGAILSAQLGEVSALCVQATAEAIDSGGAQATLTRWVASASA